MPEIEEDDIRPPPPYREGGPPQQITPDTARQGPLGKRVLVVLICSMTALVILWAGLQFVGRPGP